VTFKEDTIPLDEVAGYALQTKTDPHPKCSKQYSKYTQINPDEDRIMIIPMVMDRYLNNITIPCPTPVSILF
jgi:hypothetical protein